MSLQSKDFPLLFSNENIKRCLRRPVGLLHNLRVKQKPNQNS